MCLQVFHIDYLGLHKCLFQLKEKIRAGNVFLVPVDHTESDNLHIQVTITPALLVPSLSVRLKRF